MIKDFEYISKNCKNSNPMKKSIIILSIIIFAFTSQAQTEDSTVNSLLWEISGNGIEQPSYIFGTIHIIPKENFFFTDVMKEKFKTCKKLILEIDINISLNEKIDAAKQMILPDGKSLSDYMNDEDFTKFKTYLLDSLGIKESSFNRMQKIKPMFSSALIINDLIGKSKTYEEELNKLAKKNKMPTEGLETLQFQMDLVNKISIEDQVKMLTADDLNENPLDSYNKMLKFYKSQNLDSLKILIDQDDSMTDLSEDFLKNRNTDWIPKIEKLIKESPVFIAVGAGHLAGKDGVLNLLKENGYTITPVK